MKSLARYMTAATIGLSLSGCTPEQEAEPHADPPRPDEIASANPIYEAPELETLPESRIYHTLTDHEWYARAEPLRHDDVAYEPRGLPIAASLPEMVHVGEYQGVDYYHRDGDAEPVLYVPVFKGYWQPFRAEQRPQPQPGD